jgi:putative transposase
MTAEEWLAARGSWPDDSRGWREYVGHLIALGKCRECWADEGLENLSRGWAIGSLGWRRKLAEQNSRLVLAPDMEREEVAEIREKIWEAALATGLCESGRTVKDLATLPRRQEVSALFPRGDRAQIFW